jgi:cell division protein ZapB
MNAAGPHGVATLAKFQIDLLERQVDELIQLCRRLQEENSSLRTRQEALMTERGELIEKNEQARSRVEAMLSRLRAMEESL